MFLKFVSILWLVALFTTTVLSLPLDPSSLVRRQKGNPQREMFCTYNVKYCRDNFGGHCKEADPPPWCSVIIDAAPASPIGIDIESNTLVARQDVTPPYELAHEIFCEHNAEFCRMNYPQECMGGEDVMPAWCHVSPRRYEPPSNLPPEIYCNYSPGLCREVFAHLCKAGTEQMPAWCHIESPPTEDPDNDDKPSQEEVRAMFCKHNAQYCREIFHEDCKPGNEMLPEWCHVEQPPTEPPTEGPVNSGAPPPPERIRPIFCKYNVQYCLENFPGDCKAGNETVPVPEWCHAPNPPTTLSTSLPTDSTTLVARQDDNPARQLFCEKNAEYCQEHYPGYCKPGNQRMPSWCHIKSSPTSVATSGPTLIARQDALGKRTPQDPDREEEEREEEQEQEQEYEQEEKEKEEKQEEEEEENPHHFERSWCKQHPHHPYCYSQFCIDNPGRCKKEPDGK